LATIFLCRHCDRSISCHHLFASQNTEQKIFFSFGVDLRGALGNLYDRLTLGYVVDFLFFITKNFIGQPLMRLIQRLPAASSCC